jgi:mannose-6-phosphate isomerase class I
VFRKTTQDLAPVEHTPTTPGHYDIYPGFSIGEGRIFTGFDSLAQRIAGQRRVIIDGYGGVLWDLFRDELDAALKQRGVEANWISVDNALRSPEEIESLVAPFLGGDDPLWGTRFTGTLGDFFDVEKLRELRADDAAPMNILYGSGAMLAGWNGHLIYLDVPKNEIQFRSRAGSITNLGRTEVAPAKEMYKRFYFVDWVALNRHKEAVLPRIDTIVDEQRPGQPVWMSGDDLRAGLAAMSRNAFRARPWFEPGPWGGQWIKEHIPQLPRDVPNYAWSFELISPENGIMFESDGRLLEVSFDMVMYHDYRSILGICADRFGVEIPIRFDFLDTFDGGNLSVQCHPRTEFIRREFGENFTQDETYYILDCEPGARVYLGFRGETDSNEFRAELERSFREGAEIDIERFVNTEPAHKHDLLLIPNGTIHCSGINNLVLEISATPYIFTFKMYDWMRRDLDGNFRPLNIDRAWDNLYFDRRGERIEREFVSKPHTLATGDDWRLIHLPTHPEHFYDVHRYEFATAVEVATGNNAHVLNLVEGESIIVETNGRQMRINYAETFIVPAAAGKYRMINEGGSEAKVIVAFVKPEVCSSN